MLDANGHITAGARRNLHHLVRDEAEIGYILKNSNEIYTLGGHMLKRTIHSFGSRVGLSAIGVLLCRTLICSRFR